MPKCEITLRHGCYPVNLLHIFGTLCPNNTSAGLLLTIITNQVVNFRFYVIFSLFSILLKFDLFQYGFNFSFQ